MFANLLKAILFPQRLRRRGWAPVETPKRSHSRSVTAISERAASWPAGADVNRALRLIEALARIRYGITEPIVAAHLFALVGHESGGFRYTREIWRDTPAQLRHEGNRNLGNNQARRRTTVRRATLGCN